MTEKEKQQLRKDIESGKVDIDDLYEKYQCYLPYLPTQEAIERR